MKEICADFLHFSFNRAVMQATAELIVGKLPPATKHTGLASAKTIVAPGQLIAALGGTTADSFFSAAFAVDAIALRSRRTALPIRTKTAIARIVNFNTRATVCQSHRFATPPPPLQGTRKTGNIVSFRAAHTLSASPVTNALKMVFCHSTTTPTARYALKIATRPDIMHNLQSTFASTQKSANRLIYCTLSKITLPKYLLFHIFQFLFNIFIVTLSSKITHNTATLQH